MSSHGNRTYQSSEQAKDHNLADARRIIEEAKDHFNMTDEDLQTTRNGDWTRAAIACRIFHETTLPQAWIAEVLQMKNAPNVCRQIRLFKQAPEAKLSRKIKTWKKRSYF